MSAAIQEIMDVVDARCTPRSNPCPSRAEWERMRAAAAPVDGVTRHWLATISGGFVAVARTDEDVADYRAQGWTVTGPFVPESL